jgi:hypothetical protein
MGAEPVVFTIGETRFQLQYLPPELSLKGLDLIVERVMPILGDVLGATAKTSKAEAGVSWLEVLENLDEDKLISQIAAVARGLPELYQIFASRCAFEKSGSFVQISSIDVVFARRPTLLLAWLSECIRIEYSDFFVEAGRETLASAGQSWSSLLGLTGGSGE